MFARHSLNPLTFLIFNIVQTTIWAVLFILEIVGSVSNFGGRANPLSWLFSFIIFLSFVGLLIYASVIYHRHRMSGRRARYSHADAGEAAVTQRQSAFGSHHMGLQNPQMNMNYQVATPMASPGPVPLTGAAVEYYSGAQTASAYKSQQQGPRNDAPNTQPRPNDLVAPRASASVVKLGERYA
jgi:hypothetical protein